MHFPVEHTSNTTPGLVLWTAQKAHWATRCSATPFNKPTFEHYVSGWLQELKALLTWEPLKVIVVLQRFFNALMRYTHEGTFKGYISTGVSATHTMCNPKCTMIPRNRNVMTARQRWHNK